MSNLITNHLSKVANRKVTNIDVLNMAREKATQGFKDVVPEFKKGKISHEMINFYQYEAIRNELLDLLINKIGLTIMHDSLFETPLAPFKVEGMKLGDYIEEIHALLVEKQKFDPKSDVSPLKHVDMDAIAFYHKVSHKYYYEIEVNETVFVRAFNSEHAFDNFINNMMSIATNSDIVDEYEIAKEVIAKSFTPQEVQLPSGAKEINTPFSIVEKDDFTNNVIKTILTLSKQFALPSRTRTNNAIGQPMVTPKHKQVLFIDSDTLSDIQLRKANTFNLEALGFTLEPIDFGEFPDVVNSKLTNHRLVAVLASEDSLKQFDQVYKIAKDQNARTLADKYFLHHHYETIFSLIQNAHGIFVEK